MRRVVVRGASARTAAGVEGAVRVWIVRLERGEYETETRWTDSVHTTPEHRDARLAEIEAVKARANEAAGPRPTAASPPEIDPHGHLGRVNAYYAWARRREDAIAAIVPEWRWCSAAHEPVVTVEECEALP